MVDIHIRDISDPVKRTTLVHELLEKFGKTDLVVETLNPSPAAVNSPRITLTGDVISRDGACQITSEGKILRQSMQSDDAEMVFRARKMQGHGVHGDGVSIADEGRFWIVRLLIRDLIAIYPAKTDSPTEDIFKAFEQEFEKKEES